MYLPNKLLGLLNTLTVGYGPYPRFKKVGFPLNAGKWEVT